MKKRVQIIAVCFAWFALIAQLCLSIQQRSTSILETLIRYFSYFTILTNILVALFFTAAISRHKWMPQVLRSDNAMLAITAYIGIVGMIYHTVLSNLWQPTGMQLLVDQLLHTAMPLLMFGYWLFTANARDIRIRGVLRWLIYPILYLSIVLLRGSYSGFYPYPFLDVGQIGLTAVMRHIGFITLGTLLVLLVLFIVAKFIKPLFHITKAS